MIRMPAVARSSVLYPTPESRKMLGLGFARLLSRGNHPRRTEASCMPDVDVVQLRDVAEAAADAGAKATGFALVVMEAVDKPRNITLKGALDLVTDTDKASEDACLAVIQSSCPDHAILGEEGGVSGDVNAPLLWCIDPIDGTTNFAHGYPSFAVSVAALLKGKPVAACVVEFVGGPKAWGTRKFLAARGEGATCNGDAIKCSTNDTLQKSLLVTGFGYDHDEAWSANMRLFKHFTDVTQGVRRLGAAAVDLCHVALGIVESYWEYRLKPWDVAAGVLILEEAGGKITTMDGKPYSVFDRSVLASNGVIHDAILEKTNAETERLLEAGIDLSPWYIPEGYAVEP